MAALACFTLSAGCRCPGDEIKGDEIKGDEIKGDEISSGRVPGAEVAPAGESRALLPDAGRAMDDPLPSQLSRRLETPAPARRCPADMVDVAGELCVDRYESYLVDAASSRVLSPFYHPTRERAQRSYEYWSAPRPDGVPPKTGRAPRSAGKAPGADTRPRDSLSSEPPLPVPPAWQLAHDVRPRAENRAGMLPQGYVSGLVARQACANAGKRLCREDEWRRACRGERGHPYPYGPSHERGVCNVERDGHPAAILHGNASVGHRDPRLNLVADGDGPLLRVTGSLARCRSDWGSDAIYDMVGNLDEWVDDARGAFVGGFYARQTSAGCAARVSAHPNEYFDYSLGIRCCK
jgi:sulfatase modifying factor 1